MQSRGTSSRFTLTGLIASVVLSAPALLLADEPVLNVSGDAPLEAVSDAVTLDPRPACADLLERQLRQVEDLENRYGPYDIRLKEALKGLGYRFSREGDLLAASAAYRRALHISRVNEGLYNESQVGIMERLIEVDQQLAQWEDVDNHFAYLEHLYKKLYKIDDPRLEQGLRKVVAWHFDASNFNLGGNRLEHLRKAHGLLKLRLQSAELTLSGEDPLLDSLKRNIQRSEYYLYINSDIYRELSSERRRTLRDRYLANID